ncbi:MAG: ribosome recycling factor [Erysipelotrichaceae bacterium]|mgnify:CR=1 FL=1|nr:ribosome recycling factor [Erysipelotrichaceae bacterium]MDD3923625.1 ribosome recycling factor [Erysipelotrichaceae bacterium]MDD4641980.1 ribosome recycling factor [Erysipelotrichaceae bacterium]
MVEEHLNKTKVKMEKAVSIFEASLKNVRTGRASPSLLDHVNVDYYGMPTPLNQIAGISVVEGKQLLIKPFDPNSLKNIEKAIFEANINITPINDGTMIRLNVPTLTEETRKEMVKIVHKDAEEAKINIRNIRREQNDAVKKDDSLTEDLEKDGLERIQKLTDDFIKKIDEITAVKAKEVMTV